VAQSTKKTKSSSSRAGTRRKATGSSRNTGAKRASSSSSRSSSSGSRRKGASASQSRSGSQSRKRAGSITDKVLDTAKTTGRAATDAASKATDAAANAKTPLIAGGTALAGAAVGVLIKSRRGAGNGKKTSLGRLLGANPSKLDLDLDTVRAVATQMKNYGQQASDVADAVEKTLKKH
jgi:hypothetical protein